MIFWFVDVVTKPLNVRLKQTCLGLRLCFILCQPLRPQANDRFRKSLRKCGNTVRRNHMRNNVELRGMGPVGLQKHYRHLLIIKPVCTTEICDLTSCLGLNQLSEQTQRSLGVHTLIFVLDSNWSSCPRWPLLLSSGCGAVTAASVSAWNLLCFGENSSSLLTVMLWKPSPISAKMRVKKDSREDKTLLCILFLQGEKNKTEKVDDLNIPSFLSVVS